MVFLAWTIQYFFGGGYKKVKLSSKQHTFKQTKMVAGSVLPIAWHDGQWRILFGRETKNGNWSDFGGRCDDFNPCEPLRRQAFRVLETAARECMEETMGFMGDARSVLRDLVAYGANFAAHGVSARKSPVRCYSEAAAADEFDDDEPDAEAAVAAAEDYLSMTMTPWERHKQEMYNSNRPTALTDRCRSAARQVGMKPIWRPAFDAGANPCADWDCVIVGAYTVFLYPVAHDARLPCAFDANRKLVLSELSNDAARLFEKCELRWFTVSEAQTARADFRPFYQCILDAVLARLLCGVCSSRSSSAAYYGRASDAVGSAGTKEAAPPVSLGVARIAEASGVAAAAAAV